MKKCPYCAEEIQDAAIVCRFCGRDLEKPAAVIGPPAHVPLSQAEQDKELAKEKKGACSTTAIVLIVLIALAIIIMMNIGGGSKKVSDPKMDAWFACEELIGRNLKAPKTAEYERYQAGQVDEKWVGRYVVRMQVDSQNSFGAMIRSVFICEVNDEGDTWKLVSLEEQ